jgi:hypothetical protein
MEAAGRLKKTAMFGFTNYIGEQGAAASSKIISLVLFSEQNFGQRMDFRNFGLYATRQETWGVPKRHGKFCPNRGPRRSSRRRKFYF